MKYQLVDVERFPKALEPGVLYWSQEFETSAHLCACGCGDVIKLPIDALNFKITQGSKGFTLRPSVGNWGICNAHYFITNGQVEWLAQMSPAAIKAGRTAEDARRKTFYARKRTWQQRLRAWLNNVIKRLFG